MENVKRKRKWNEKRKIKYEKKKNEKTKINKQINIMNA